MTKTQKVDLLLDAIGMIGDDIIAESSGVSNVLPIPSKLKINLMVMRRLLAAAICLMIVSAITPLSVYLYNNYIAPAFQPSESTNEEVADTTAESESSETEITEYPLEIPEGYSVIDSVGFEMLSSSANGNEQSRKKARVALLSSATDAPAIFVELRSYDGKTVTDTLFERGHGMVLISKNYDEFLILNTEITVEINKEGYAQIVKYTVTDGEFYESTEFLKRITYFKLFSNADLESSRIDTYNMFIDFSEELTRQSGARVILDTYTTDEAAIHTPSENVLAPDIVADRKSGKNTWTIDRIAEVNGFVRTEEPLPENQKTYETSDGWLISGITAEPELYKVVGCTDKMGKTATVPTEFLGYKVCILSHAALQNCRAETLIIPAGLERVEMQLWGDSIKKLIIECDDSTEFVDQCFLGTPIEEVVFTGNKTVIEKKFFYLCRNLKKVTLPATLETVSEMAFQDCEVLEELNLPEGIKVIEKRAFYSCNSIKNLVLPASLEEIGVDAFAICTQLESVEICSKLEVFPMGLFFEHNCESITVPEGVRIIEDLSVDGNALKYLYLPSTLEIIETYRIDVPSSGVESVYYNGTKDMWNKVEKRKLISTEYNEYTVYCTDGEIVMFPGGLPME